MHSPLSVSRPDGAEGLETRLSGSLFHYKGFHKIKIPLVGKYQIINACTALEVVEILRDLGYDMEENAVYEGMASVKWPGRFEKLSDRPIFLIDGAHNPEAAKRLKDSLNLYFPNRRMIYIMGILADKDYREIVKITAPLADQIYTVTPESPRALPGESLACCIKDQAEAIGFCGRVQAESSIRKAVWDAVSQAGEDGVVAAFGSLSYLGELSEALKESIHD